MWLAWMIEQKLLVEADVAEHDMNRELAMVEAS